MPADRATHDVTNQPPLFEGRNLLDDDAALREAIVREGAGDALSSLKRFGAECGSREAFERGRLANEHLPRLRTHDRQGRRLDVVEYHPAYHECMRASFAQGLHCSVWEHLAYPGARPPPGANVARAAGSYMAAQMEAGHCCPITMTNAAIPSLLLSPDVAREWVPRILSRTYDAAFAPAAKKASVTIGMGMTEKQGGTDVRANTTAASPADGAYRLTGHKWFLSAPMSDAFLVLAQAPKGLSCFLVPRFRPDGTVNALYFQRLKDKLGNRSNASSEVEFEGASGWLVGEEGRGVPTIVKMVSATRLDCAVSSAGLMRLALANAVHHARYRTVYQKRLLDQPLMQQVLADMALDVEAATALAFRLARAFDHPGDEDEAAWARLMTPVTKYWVCKTAPPLVYEAMECLGGNGYVEDGLLARLYREVPVNAIWEGSGNVMALDVLRVLQREPDVAEAVLDQLRDQAGGHKAILGAIDAVQALLHEPRLLDVRARELVERLAQAAAATLLHAYAPPTIANAFVCTRLEPQLARRTYGQGIERHDTRSIVDRVLPEQ